MSNAITTGNPCRYCGALAHQGMCPRVEEIEYFKGGGVKRVKLRDPARPPGSGYRLTHPFDSETLYPPENT